MSFWAIVILYVLIKIVLPLLGKILVKKGAQTKYSGRGQSFDQFFSRRTGGSAGDLATVKVDYEPEIELQPEAKSKLVVAEPYEMIDLDHDESQHQTRIKPTIEQNEILGQEPTFRATNLRHSFIMAEILDKPRALKEWGGEW